MSGSRCVMSVHIQLSSMSYPTAPSSASIMEHSFQARSTPSRLARWYAACRPVQPKHKISRKSRCTSQPTTSGISHNKPKRRAQSSLRSQLDSSPFSRVPAIGSFLHPPTLHWCCTMTVYPTFSGGGPLPASVKMGADDEACFVPIRCLL